MGIIVGGLARLLAAVGLPAFTAFLAAVRPGGAFSEPTPSTPEALSRGVSALRASVRAPARVDYDPRSLGIAGQFVAIRVENAGDASVSVTHLHASFAATRDGVAFPCNAHVGVTTGAVEPSHLDPGRSFTFERLLDCTMPLPGRYDVRAWIHVAPDESRGREARAGVFLGSFQVDVTATAGNAPRPLPSRPGLYALMTGAPTAAPMTSSAWAKGGYQVVVALINGSGTSAPVGPAHVSLLVFKRGEALPCKGREEQLWEPPSLPPGAMHVVRVPVTCAPAGEGRYDIVGRFALAGGAEVEIGRVGLLVTQSPEILFTPEWPPLPVTPTPGGP
jgi:hypothetical protein